MTFATTQMDFSHALIMLKEGRTISREDWHDPSMFLYLVPADEYISFTDVAKREFGPKVHYGAYIALKTHSGNVVPWGPSSTDILADDWKVIT